MKKELTPPPGIGSTVYFGTEPYVVMRVMESHHGASLVCIPEHAYHLMRVTHQGNVTDAAGVYKWRV